ncbi:MAG: hypothetical protein ABL871_17365, partial [Terricaulis sp.]
MLRNTRRAGLLACAILLTACASQSAIEEPTPVQDQSIAPLSPPPPPPPPPSPLMAQEMGRSRAAIG